MERIVTDQKYAPGFCNWLGERFGGTGLDPATTRTIGYVDFESRKDGVLTANILAVAALHHWSQHACEVTVASNGEKRKKASVEYIYTVFSYVFEVCGKSVLYATISEDNHKSLALANKLGLIATGEIPEFFGPGTKAIVLSITKAQWKAGHFANIAESQ